MNYSKRKIIKKFIKFIKSLNLKVITYLSTGNVYSVCLGVCIVLFIVK